MEINKPDDLGDIADLGLTLAKGKLLLAGIQREIGMANLSLRHLKSNCSALGNPPSSQPFRKLV
jgi:hypothetical protein